MSDGFNRHTPTLAGNMLARVIVVDESLAPHVGDAITQLTNEWTWRESGSTIDEVISSCFDSVDSYYLNLMIGSISLFLGSAPSFYLALDGTTYNQSDYPELAQVLDPTFRDDLAETFTLPDMRDMFALGAGSNYPLGSLGGESEHTLTSDEMPNHTHDYQSVNIDIDVKTVGAPIPYGASIGPILPTTAAGAGQSHENKPPYIALTWCIFAGR